MLSTKTQSYINDYVKLSNKQARLSLTLFLLIGFTIFGLYILYVYKFHSSSKAFTIANNYIFIVYSTVFILIIITVFSIAIKTTVNKRYKLESIIQPKTLKIEDSIIFNGAKIKLLKRQRRQIWLLFISFFIISYITVMILYYKTKTANNKRFVFFVVLPAVLIGIVIIFSILIYLEIIDISLSTITN